MESAEDVVATALDTVKSAALTPTEHLLLKRFLDKAQDSSCAAIYLLRKVEENPSRSVEANLREFKKDWRRLVTKFTKQEDIPLPSQCLLKSRDMQNCCCMVNRRGRLAANATFNVEPAWIIPPSIFHDDELAYESPLLSILEAFLTPDVVRWLRGMLESCTEPKNALQNLLLLSPSVQSAFREGHLEITRGLGPVPPKKIEPDAKSVHYLAIALAPGERPDLTLSNGEPLKDGPHMFTMYTRNPSLYPLPSEELLQIHSKIATALHLFSVEDDISLGWLRSPYISLSKTVCQYIRSCWHFVPKPIRVWCYLFLAQISKRFYPYRGSLVQQLPFGLYMKNCHRARYNEVKALQIIEQHTSIPAPLFIDTFEHQGKVMLVMTRVRGQQLQEVFYRLSYPERTQLSADLHSAIKQLRAIPNTTPHRFANVLGGPLLDVRLPDSHDRARGPFDNELDFHDALIHKFIFAETKQAVAHVHSRSYRSFFSHADLNFYNIIIERGKLSGIVDWECAGYYPEYWEFTKGIYIIEGAADREKIIRDAFPDEDYQDELEAEKVLWFAAPPWV
ncbi:TPA_exp: Uncharacterized protein A8136_3013 [Trichophyton benhamiae CBS 112371]|nr:TPA_exp: Uncharacterized protein A8136_3013 [Trichophyton benhamiae CBS 112371]